MTSTYRLFKLIVSALFLLLISACVRTDQLGLDWRKNIQFANSPSILKNQVMMGSVTGDANGRVIPINAFSQNQLYTALSRSLSDVNLLAKMGEGRFLLETEIIDVVRPYAGLDRIAEVNIRYTIIDVKNSDIVYDKKIQSPFYMRIEDNYSPFTWGRTGIEKATSKNLHLFIEELFLLDDYFASLDEPKNELNDAQSLELKIEMDKSAEKESLEKAFNLREANALRSQIFFKQGLSPNEKSTEQ